LPHTRIKHNPFAHLPLAAKGLLRIEDIGKATRYAMAIDLWVQPDILG